MSEELWLIAFENTKQQMMEDYDGPLGMGYEPTDDEVVAEMEKTSAYANVFSSIIDSYEKD